jgi:glycosyltransferase involved in cell wall biosynthesis
MNTDRKKILYLITKSNWGGAQRYVYDLATALDKNLFEPVVAMGGEGVLSEMLHNAGVRIIILDEMKNKLSLTQARKAASELRRVLKVERPDVLHVNSSTAGLIGALVGHTTRVPTIIFTAHGWAFNEDRSLPQRLLLKALHYVTVMLSDRTIAVSRAIVSQMNWPGAQRKMKVINPGRTIGVTYERTEAREKLIGFCHELAPFQNDTWLVTIAELHPIKRHLVLLDAFRQLPTTDGPLRLILIGEGKERERIETYIATHHLEGRVILTGNITEAARFLKAFDLFVLASKSESYGYVLHEAGLAGVPIIATNVGGIPDIIDNHRTGLLVPPDNAPALETAIHSLLTNTTQTVAYATALQEELRGRSVAKMARQTEGLY